LAYRIALSGPARDHLRRLTARERATVLDQVDRQLLHQPTVRTRNPKPIEPNVIATWELRVGHMRVYYRVWEAEEQTVEIVGIGVKIRSRVRLGDEEIDFP
jgi:mRNA-degrading endonuclease RelE of RelBE toxin-antitoxin system